MKKTVITMLLLFAVSCGGGAGQGDSIESSGLSPQPGEGEVGDLSISAIKGDGSAADRFASALIVDGVNFSEGMDVNLVSTTATESYNLSYTVVSSTQIKASLPTDLDEGEFELTITKSTEKASAKVTILRGEQGPAGVSGLTLAEEFSCGLSSDIDNTSTIRNGISVIVSKFSDGGYFISCLVGYSGTYTDTSSFSTWYSYNSVGVANGKISCIPMYVTAEYSIANQSVTYINQADNSQKQTISCTKVFP